MCDNDCPASSDGYRYITLSLNNRAFTYRLCSVCDYVTDAPDGSIKQCVDVCPSEKPYVNDGVCSQTCSGSDYYVENGKNKICWSSSQKCKLIIQRSPVYQCSNDSLCPEGYFLQTGKQQKCVLKCETKYIVKIANAGEHSYQC